jgi:hypothetical protein
MKMKKTFIALAGLIAFAAPTVAHEMNHMHVHMNHIFAHKSNDITHTISDHYEKVILVPTRSESDFSASDSSEGS